MDADGLSIRTIVGLLRRRFMIILACVAIVVAIAVAALFAIKPVYSAVSTVIVDPVKRNLLQSDDPFGDSWSSSRIDSEAELIISRTTLHTVAENLDLDQVPEFGAGRLGLREQFLSFFRLIPPVDLSRQDALDNAASALAGVVSVSRRGLTSLIDISASSENPDLAAAIANEVAKVYVDRQLRAKIESVLAAQSILEDRISSASDNVASSEQAFDDFIESNIERISQETGRTDLATLRAEFEASLARRDQLDSTIDEAQARLAQRNWGALAASLQTDTISTLNQEREAAATQLAGIAAGSDEAVNLRAELERIEATLTEEATRTISGLQSEIAGLQSRAADSRSQLRATVLSSDLPADVLTSLYELQQSSEIARAQYQTVLTRQKDLEAQAYLQLPDSRVVSEAGASGTPSFPRPNIILSLALIIGLFGGVAIAFLVENFVGGITSEEQAETVLGHMVVSSIPRQRPTKKPNSSDPPLVADALVLSPLSGYSESIRRMRIGLDQAIMRTVGVPEAERTMGRVIMVTSSIPNEGKTTIALSLARAYALSGRSTLLVDCDLRRPGLHRQLGREPSDGLIDYLSGRKQAADIQSFMIQDPGSEAQIILGSRRSDVPTDQLVAGRTFNALVTAARTNFDVVILDTPPVGPVVDALYIANLCDAIAYVIKWSETPLQQVKQALESLERAKRDEVQILTVVNQWDKTPAGYKGRYSDYYLES
jgi:polysaccharide biosynthesis transport protein